MNTAVMFSSAKDDWSTPQDFFDNLNEEFNFELDVCASPENAKCNKFYTKEQNGLVQNWGGCCWCNPPYGREVGQWVQKASLTSAEGNTVVMLLPARTDTRWFHDYIYQKQGVEVRFIKGRLKFGNSKAAAPFPSMVVIFKGCGQMSKENLTNTQKAIEAVEELYRGVSQCPTCEYCRAYNEAIEDAVKAIKNIPHAGVQSIVRCKDCIKNGRFDCPMAYIEKQTLCFLNHDPDFFCAYGAKMDEKVET